MSFSPAHAVTYRTSQYGSRSYAAGYAQAQNMATQQQLAQQAEYQEYQAQQANDAAFHAAAIAAIPVQVASPEIAEAIAAGDESYGVSLIDTNYCASIFPSGKMVWDRPTAGLRPGGDAKCGANVEMRIISGNNDVVLASVIIAAGDSIECNISAFPETGYTDAAFEITFPADREPTMEDVVRVMNEEQKQNAALRIAAGAAIGALGGNLLGKGDGGLAFGTDRGKVQSAVVGAVVGAGLMTGNVYGGKVVGDTVLSAGVNAVAGGVVGNMMATGSALLVDSCTIDGRPTKCLFGVVQKWDDKTYEGQHAFLNIDNTDQTILCDEEGKGCGSPTLMVGFTVDGKSLEEAAVSDFYALRNSDRVRYLNEDKTQLTGGVENQASGTWVEISGGGKPVQRVAAMIPDFPEKTFGSSGWDFAEWRNGEGKDREIYERKPDRSNGRPMRGDGYTLAHFFPTYQNAEDGGMIDLGNRSRLKATVIGSAAGGGLGGFSGYMGAQNDIEQRWVSAVREYKDSLQKIYCATGTRFLGQYNDLIIIPNVKIPE